jgi:TPR repeat protein
MAPPGERYTRFTGSLAYVLETSDRALSLVDIAEEIRRYLKKEHPDYRTFPEVYAPHQDAGNLMIARIFGRRGAANCAVSSDRSLPAAQFKIGMRHALGLDGLTKDEQEAVRFYEYAANQGLAEAQYVLALHYELGRGGLPRDKREAVRLYKRAADKGLAEAQCALGSSHAMGEGGLEEDSQEAVRLYKLAAAQSLAEAQFMLAECYASGSGVTKDEQEAIRLYTISAKNGYRFALFVLGLHYGSGRCGLRKDQQKAERLCNLAAPVETGHCINLETFYKKTMEFPKTESHPGMRAHGGDVPAAKFVVSP